MKTTRRPAGFTLVEVAVVLLIVALLSASILRIYTTQTAMGDRKETARRLDEARELLLAYAIVHKRLPCPAKTPPTDPSDPTVADEYFTSGSSAAGGVCAQPYSGYLPGKVIGSQEVNPRGYAVDSWSQPIRYAVSVASTSQYTTVYDSTTMNDTYMATVPSEFIICSEWLNSSTTACAADATQAAQRTMAQGPVFVVWSQGRNNVWGGATGDELANKKATSHGIFVSRGQTDVGSSLGEFDDQVLWVSPAALLSTMIKAGVLP